MLTLSLQVPEGQTRGHRLGAGLGVARGAHVPIFSADGRPS